MGTKAYREEGFTLFELLIVVAIILIVATMAIPSFLRARQHANENSAVANLRTLSSAQATYVISSGGSYGTVGQLVGAGLLDTRFNGPVTGYSYSVDSSGFDFTATASPVSANLGRYAFYLVPDGVIRYSTISTMAPTGLSGSPVQ
jgi:prepilin-type N-terminal cleavage/methylation domain-containing protein